MARPCSTTPSPILASADGAAGLAADPAAKDFVTDAHHHCKLIAYHPDAAPLLDAAGVLAEVDEGYVALDGRSAPSTFLERCRKLRHWDRDQAARHGVMPWRARSGQELVGELPERVLRFS